MKKLFTFCALLLLGGSLVYSQLLTENFSYPAGDSIAAHGWVLHGGGSNMGYINVVSPGLNYTGYAGSGTGNAAIMPGGATGNDFHRTYTNQTSGSVYLAVLVKVDAASTSGDYFIHLGPNPISTTFRGRLFVKKETSGSTTYAFGISNSSSTVSYTSYDYAFGTTYLVVIRCEFGQNAKLFVNPVIGQPEPTATATASDAVSDPTNFGAVALRQGGSSSSPNVTVDGIRIATTWSVAVASGGSTANQPPNISGLSRDPYIPVNEALIGATVTDDHNVTDVKLYYTANSVTDSMNMDPTGADTYEAEIPAKPNGTYVTYFIKAKDDSGAVTISSTQKYFSGTTNISALRVNDGNGLSIYNNVPVRVRGIVTGGDSSFSASNVDIYIQDATSGIHIFKNGWTSYPEGRDLTVEGSVKNYNGKLQFENPTITNNGTGTIPAPTVITPTQLKSETYEGMLVDVTGVTFDLGGIFDSTGQLRFGGTSYYFNGDSTNVIYIDRQLWDEFHNLAIPTGAVKVRGIVTQYKTSSPYTSGYQLIPRKTADINVSVSVKDDEIINPKAFSLGQNFPNPFNPTTTISYEIPKASDISIKVYNLLGQEIRTLFSGKQNAGKFVITWDGRDNAGKAVSTGIYFYRLNAPNFIQTRKMIMIK